MLVPMPSHLPDQTLHFFLFHPFYFCWLTKTGLNVYRFIFSLRLAFKTLLGILQPVRHSCKIHLTGSMCTGLLIPVICTGLCEMYSSKKMECTQVFFLSPSLCHKLYLKTHWFHAFTLAFLGLHIPLQMYEIADLSTLHSLVLVFSVFQSLQVCSLFKLWMISFSFYPKKLSKTYLRVHFGVIRPVLRFPLKPCPALDQQMSIPLWGDSVLKPSPVEHLCSICVQVCAQLL